jgi:diguanylate cyclase
MMMDGDNFKGVNDRYGHLTGSKTLEEIGLSITTNLRSGDAAARFGGDEFAAFLLDADMPQALIAAERIRASIESYKFSVLKQARPKQTHHITVSIGISSFPDDSSDPIELVEMADSALYRAKREGRNRHRRLQRPHTRRTQRRLAPSPGIDLAFSGTVSGRSAIKYWNQQS